MVQAIAEKNGINLDVGPEKDFEDLTTTWKKDEEGPDPQEVAARMVAHIGHRVPVLRKFEKRFEGRDKRAGIASDFGSLLGTIYLRNKKKIDQVAADILSGKISLKKERPINAGVSSNGNGDGSHIDFGPVGNPSQGDGNA